MTITWNNRQYSFRECDVVGFTREEVERKAIADGYMQYEPRCAWLFVPGIGFGWEVE